MIGGLGFGESPRWHGGRLWLSDMEDGKVLAVAPDGSVESSFDVAGTPSGIGWLPDGRMLVVSMARRSVLVVGDTGEDEPAVHAELSAFVGGDCNELVVDGSGRAYVGNVGFDHHVLPFAPEPTRLVLVEPDGTARPVGGEILVPNGTVVTPGGETLILAETLSNRLTAFAIEPDGSLAGQRIFAELPGRLPDGICLDAEGGVWIADSASTSCVRVVEGGAIADEVDAGRPCFACMLGGESGSTLFVVTADGYDAESKSRHTGAVERVEVRVPRAGWP